MLMTIYRHGDFMGVFGVWVYSLTLVLIFENHKKQTEVLLQILLVYLEILLLVNAVLIVLFPHGMYRGDYNQYGQMWLLGYKSSLQCYVLPAVFLALIQKAYTNSSKHLFFILILSHAESLIERNAMLLAILVFFDTALYFRLYKKDIITLKTVFVGFAAVIFANIFVVFFTEKLFSISFFQYVLVNLLGKNPTLSLRTSNWKAVWGAIKQSPLIGYGYTSDLTRSILYGRETAHAHNIFLEMLYEGGIVQVIIYLIFIFTILEKLLKNRHTSIAKVIFVFFGLYYIMYIFENPMQKSNGAIWLLFIIGYYSKYINRTLQFSYLDILGLSSLKGNALRMV